MVAKNEKDAIHITETFDGQIDLALLDIKLPDMDGGRVYPLIMEARPDMKVIVCSGYSIHGPAQHPFLHFLFPASARSRWVVPVLRG
jgi:CheY-like chemotaxis protein